MSTVSAALPATSSPAPAPFARCARCDEPTPLRDLDPRQGWCQVCRIEDFEDVGEGDMPV